MPLSAAHAGVAEDLAAIGDGQEESSGDVEQCAIRGATQAFCIAVLEVVCLTASTVALRVSLLGQSRRYFSER